ncbi:PTS glucose transporter subunit IIA [Paenibacillus zeisoli]|uniref:PTS glucose transporter subunit IIA n=1 Tax=Paenibacillus zeisoli TaxID=2496267 RepID=A0A3S1CY40_9BACL|nr:PTS glucose transporter subunit IIA [Paenibacillus zeisoli]RUT29839.1 PTS glucose transporter subunit IIA [Paenibacillus zeisoli]
MFSKWRKKSTEQKKVEIYAPVTGEAVALSAVPDEAFAGGFMGKGMAIEPSEGKLTAPFDGTAIHVIKSKHAVILEHSSGLQLLFHIGINTVSLRGEGFISHVQTGDTVKAGQTLIEFDIPKIKEAGYPVITSVIATNAEELTEDIETNLGPVQSGRDVILTAIFKA